MFKENWDHLSPGINTVLTVLPITGGAECLGGIYRTSPLLCVHSQALYLQHFAAVTEAIRKRDKLG